MEFIEIRIYVPKPSRQWLQFSLRTLLVVLTVAAIWFAFYIDRERCYTAQLKGAGCAHMNGSTQRTACSAPDL